MTVTEVPVVLIVVCLILGVCALSGIIKGFVRKISGIVSFIAACILVNALLPTITTALRTTPVYTVIREQCESVGENLVQGAFSNMISSQAERTGTDPAALVSSVTADDGSGKLDRDKIKAQLQAMGYDPSIIDSMSDADLESYAQQIIGATAGMLSQATLFSGEGAWLLPEASAADEPLLSAGGAFPAGRILLTDGSGYGTQDVQKGSGSSVLSQLTSGMDRAEQTKFIEDLPIPDVLKNQLEAFNNSAGYLRLGAADFGSYIVSYFANLIMNVLAFVVTLLVAWLIIHLILLALSVFTRLPVVGTADRLLGLALGLIQGLLLVWALFLVLSMFAATPAGEALMQEIYRTPFLELLYNNNLFLSGAARAIRISL